MSAPPVSATLEAELAAYVRAHGIVVWLDREGQYAAFVDRLATRHREGTWPFPVVAHRGSWLSFLVALDGHADGADAAPLLVHLPGHNEESVRGTPALEVYEVGARFRKALPTLLLEAGTGRVAPDAVRRWLEGRRPTLEEADAWLEAEAVRVEGGLRAELQRLTLPALLDDLLGPRQKGVRTHVLSPLDEDVLWDHLARVAGMDRAWCDLVGDPERPDVDEAGYLLGTWALCVEYVHDLRRKPYADALRPLADLPRPLVQANAALAAHLRAHAPDTYVDIANACEGLLYVEVSRGAPEDLGRIDTFRFEEACVLVAAIRGLDEEAWDRVSEWASAREGERSFWVRRDPERRAAWRLVGDGAALGKAVAAAGELLQGCTTLEEAVERYVARGAAVDRAHRHLEQRRLALLDSRLPHYGDLCAELDSLRGVYRDWADEVGRGFNALCRAVGFLPDTPCLQRALFEQVVRPLAEELPYDAAGPVALFVVDALRYEMAEDLAAEMRGEPGAAVRLDARLAELPSVTEIGMNVLAPVAADGRLAPVWQQGAFGGFRTQEFIVKDPESRRRRMASRVRGEACPLLALPEVVGRTVEQLKGTIRHAGLVIVHSTEIDEGGESNVGLAVFENALRQLRAAWRLLREAGVRRFVVTADHGFLLLDDTTAATRAFGKKMDPSARWAAYPEGLEAPGVVAVSLAQLGYDGAGYLCFPDDTKVFDTGQRRRTFVHGGNSLQERIIPVLTARYRGAAGGSDSRYEVEVEGLPPRDGKARVAVIVKLASAQAALAFGGTREVDLALRVPGRPDIRVEVVDARDALPRNGGLRARVGTRAEVLFKLLGEGDERLPIEVFHPTRVEDVAGAVTAVRFDVTARATREPRPTPGGATSEVGTSAWLEAMDEGPRKVFAHLARFGVVTEAEATAMLGGPRPLRRFSNELEALCERAPFRVRVEMAAGGKRYVREGG